MMDDLISRKALQEAMYHEAFEMDSDMQKWDAGCWIRYKMFENHLKDAPSVPAVPLDKLCDLLSKHVGKIRCNDCWVACSDPCPGTADDWRRAVTKWMEGLK